MKLTQIKKPFITESTQSKTVADKQGDDETDAIYKWRRDWLGPRMDEAMRIMGLLNYQAKTRYMTDHDSDNDGHHVKTEVIDWQCWPKGEFFGVRSLDAFLQWDDFPEGFEEAIEDLHDDESYDFHLEMNVGTRSLLQKHDYAKHYDVHSTFHLEARAEVGQDDNFKRFFERQLEKVVDVKKDRQKFKNAEEIRDWFRVERIPDGNYRINPDLTVDTKGTSDSLVSRGLHGIPFKFGEVDGLRLLKNPLTTIEWMPKGAVQINIDHTGIDDLSGIGRILKKCQTFTFGAGQIKKGMLELASIEGMVHVGLYSINTQKPDPWEIINDHLKEHGARNKILELRKKLIEAGHESIL